jgi:class 3 adenylate cyclase
MGSHQVPITFRFGIHCGEVVAGVISKERFTFDVLGDTVNTASRMESTSMPNMIQVSEEVKSRLEHRFEFTDNGVHQVKGKGRMHTYFLVNEMAKKQPGQS